MPSTTRILTQLVAPYQSNVTEEWLRWGPNAHTLYGRGELHRKRRAIVLYEVRVLRRAAVPVVRRIKNTES